MTKNNLPLPEVYRFLEPGPVSCFPLNIGEDTDVDKECKLSIQKWQTSIISCSESREGLDKSQDQKY
ncbi:MAG: hypothetical protein PHY93_11755 [Bacteriovorax sp.]|nr:hypothetical protein [Bacteriovorax sp.]